MRRATDVNYRFCVLKTIGTTIGWRILPKLKELKVAVRMRVPQPLAEVGKWLRSAAQG